MKKTFTIEEVRGFKPVDESLLEKLKSVLIDDEDMEELIFEHKGVMYGFNEVGSDPEIDEGKYTCGCNYHHLVSFDTTVAAYPCGGSQLNAFDVVVTQGYSKAGSYFSDYEWYYDKPSVKKLSVKVVPEVIIPEHEEVDVENI